MSNLAGSRSLPPRLERMLLLLSDSGSLLVDNRNKTALRLIDLAFAAETSREKRKIGLSILPRGETALKRQARGVDPYLVMMEEGT